uniref:FAD-dependent oxidoreductase n=1 Tax=Candidatus Electrothrix sp. TaxID=2170559 RepID=UPI0040566375
MNGDEDINLVAIDAKDYFENTPNSTECILDPTATKQHLVNYTANAAIKKDGVFKQGLITGITSDGITGEVTLSNGEKIAFDYAILGTGSSYSQIKAPLTSQTTIADRLTALQSQQEAMSSSDAVVVVGAGPVGVEIAAAVAETFPGKKVTLVCSKERILDAFAVKASEIAAAWLVKKGVTILYNERVVDWGTATDQSTGSAETVVTTDKGTSLSGLLYRCLGGKPNTSAFATNSPAVKLTSTGAIDVESTLQVKGMPNIFAAGDVCSTDEEKTANYADYAGMVAAANVKMLAKGKEQKELMKFPAGIFKGAEILPFVSGATLGKSSGVMQMGDSQVQSGASIGYMRGFFGKMIMGSVKGSWFWGRMYKGVKMMFAGVLAGLAKSAANKAATTAKVAA